MGIRTKFYVDIMAMQAEVTGSCNICCIRFPDGSKKKFIVDCGLFQEPEYLHYNTELSFNPETVDFVVVTHNHVDHTGRLPLLVKQGYCGNIYATMPTCRLLRYALSDSCKLQKIAAKKANTKCLYTSEDVSQTLKYLVPCNFLETIAVDNNIKMTFFYNGHLPGAALILFQISYPEYDDINLLFTGDYNNKNMFFDVPALPNWVNNLSISIIQESTYGDTDSSTMKEEFSDNVLKAIKEDKTIIIPVFALGRAQEVLYKLKTLQDNHFLSTEVPIYLDGKLALNYTKKFLDDDLLGLKEEIRNFLPRNFKYVDDLMREKLLKDRKTKIILTTSGMGSFGPAQRYLPEYLQVEDALIHFTGYTTEGTLGARLKGTLTGDITAASGILVVKRALVEYTTEYSAHAKADEMIEFLKQFSNLRLVLVTHGEDETKRLFAERIMREVSPKKIGILNREFVFRINAYGLVKTINTKFR